MPSPHEKTRRDRPGRLPRGRPGRADETSGAEPDPALLESLKAWRTEEARRRGVPAYIVFHDRTLRDLAVMRPRDADGLGAVPGMGPAKMAAYSETLLRLLSRSGSPRAD